MTRKLSAHFFSSLDGVVSDPFEFQFDSFDQATGEAMDKAIAPVDDIVLGRITYSQWAEYWPNQAPEEDMSFADFINPVRKHVASRTLSQADLAWENSHLMDADLIDYVQRLKEGEGGEIAVAGSIQVARQLLIAGLLDTLTLTIHPAVAGKGTRLFDGVPPTRLDLVDSLITEKGNAILTYAPKK